MDSSEKVWAKVDWFLDLGFADSALFGLDVDQRWRLLMGDPAGGSLGVCPIRKNGRRATLTDVVWLSDCIAYDHDSPVGITPAQDNTRARFPYEPVVPMHGGVGAHRDWYFGQLSMTYSLISELRFGGDTLIPRYGDDHAPSTDFSRRFAGREGLVSLYAMATRQTDLLAEYLCLYRILEAVDGANGKTFAAARLPHLRDHDFGQLWVYMYDHRIDGGNPERRYTDVFAHYRTQALAEVRRLRRRGLDIPTHLYDVRNSLAHGKYLTRTSDFGATVTEVSKVLPLVKSLARMAVEP